MTSRENAAPPKVLSAKMGLDGYGQMPAVTEAGDWEFRKG